MAVKKRCPCCGHSIKLRNDGTFYNHAIQGTHIGMNLVAVTTKNRCSGSRRKFEHAKAIADDRAERTDLHVGCD